MQSPIYMVDLLLIASRLEVERDELGPGAWWPRAAAAAMSRIFIAGVILYAWRRVVTSCFTMCGIRLSVVLAAGHDTGARAKAWCLHLHAEASVSLFVCFAMWGIRPTLAAPAPMPESRCSSCRGRRLDTTTCTTGSRAPATTATPLGARPARHGGSNPTRPHEFPYPTDSDAPEITSGPRAARPLRRSTLSRLTGSRAPAPTAAPPGART